MNIIDFEHLCDTTSYVFFQVQFTSWYWPWKIVTKKFIKEKSTGEFYNIENFKRPYRRQEIVFNAYLEHHDEIEKYRSFN